MQLLMDADVEGLIGASRYERNSERCTWRNGFRDRSLDTRLGPLQLRIPKLRRGSYFPPFLEARKSSENALVTVIQEALYGALACHVALRPCIRLDPLGIHTMKQSFASAARFRGGKDPF